MAQLCSHTTAEITNAILDFSFSIVYYSFSILYLAKLCMLSEFSLESRVTKRWMKTLWVMLNEADRESSLRCISNLRDSDDWRVKKNKCYYMKATLKRNRNKV